MTTTLAAIIASLSIFGGDPPSVDAPEGMVWIPEGTFQMGSVGPLAGPQEGPVHPVRVSGFWIDAHEVTNDAFAAFVAATSYVTVAERPVDWNELKKQLPPGTPKPPEEVLQPGSLVFVSPGELSDRRHHAQWWQWTPGASWRHPEGPGSSLDGRGQHPVVHIAWEDAVAYARWAKKRLPTEAEWERAARGGLAGATYTWGNEDPTNNDKRANIWQGTFPTQNTARDGFAGTAPVGSYAPNGFDLYDMGGNVWEWCADWYRADAYTHLVGELHVDPQGPSKSLDPAEPLVPKRVVRGGSFLCHESYCLRYRPSARIGTAVDSGMSHLGFRCVQDARVDESTQVAPEESTPPDTSSERGAPREQR